LEGFSTACCHLLYQRWSLGRQALLRVRTIVYSALQNYNDFAQEFGGHFAHDRIYWEKDIALNDGSKLRIRGLNNAIGCNKERQQGHGQAADDQLGHSAWLFDGVANAGYATQRRMDVGCLESSQS
jgi:hypothetical protein